MAGVTITLRSEITITDTSADSEEVAQKIVLDKSITNVTSYRRTRFSIQNTNRIVWDAAGTGEEITTFQFLALWTDVAVDIEMTIGEGEATEELVSLSLGTNAPLILVSDDAYRNHSASNVWGGTLDVIDKIRVKEGNNVLATVHMLLAEA